MYSEKQSCTQQGNIMGTTKSVGISCTPGTCITIIFRGIKSLRFEVNPENYQLCDIICKLNNWPFGSLHLNGSYSSREDWGSSSKGWNHETIRIELYSSVCMNESTLGVCVRGCWWLNCNPIFRRNVQFILKSIPGSSDQLPLKATCRYFKQRQTSQTFEGSIIAFMRNYNQ